MFLEDIGPTIPAMDHMKKLIRAGEDEEVEQFEDQVIELTHRLIGAGIIDTDHSFVNTVVGEAGMPVRLDFEAARRRCLPRLRHREMGQMLGRLIATHAFTVQPQVERTASFARRLTDRLAPPRAALSRCRDEIEQRMARQREDTGIDTRVELPW